jgi:hypothetical protein
MPRVLNVRGSDAMTLDDIAARWPSAGVAALAVPHLCLNKASISFGTICSWTQFLDGKLISSAR